jgi:hypothetical protein
LGGGDDGIGTQRFAVDLHEILADRGRRDSREAERQRTGEGRKAWFHRQAFHSVRGDRAVIDP